MNGVHRVEKLRVQLVDSVLVHVEGLVYPGQWICSWSHDRIRFDVFELVNKHVNLKTFVSLENCSSILKKKPLKVVWNGLYRLNVQHCFIIVVSRSESWNKSRDNFACLVKVRFGHDNRTTGATTDIQQTTWQTRTLCWVLICSVFQRYTEPGKIHGSGTMRVNRVLLTTDRISRANRTDLQRFGEEKGRTQTATYPQFSSRL